MKIDYVVMNNREIDSHLYRVRAIYMRLAFAPLLTLVLTHIGQAQNYSDCINAMEVCADDSIFIQFEYTNGSVLEGIEDFCMSEEIDSSFFESFTVWFKYSFVTDGEFLFTITPAEMKADMDFVVFKSDVGNCDDLQAIRCMFSGNLFGTGDYRCMGPTGLSAISSDTVEFPGCPPSDDNFLAPVEVNEGDVLYLAVKDYHNDQDYVITHSGSALIGCNTTSVEETSSQLVKLFPNPATDHITIVLPHEEAESLYLFVYDVFGRNIMQSNLIQTTTIPIGEEIPDGTYFYCIRRSNGDVQLTGKLVLH